MPATTVYVAGDASGDYNCDGTDDHVQINQALSDVQGNGSTVYLKGPFTYIIDDSILVGADTTFTGDSTAKIKLKNSAGWNTKYKGLVMPIGGAADNVTIHGFEIDGNAANQSEATGHDYYPVIKFDDSDNLIVHDMSLHDAKSDAVWDVFSSFTAGVGNLQMYNNIIRNCAHDGLYSTYVDGMEIYNNDMNVRTNCGVRVLDSNNTTIYDNIIDGAGAVAGHGIQIQKTTSGVPINSLEIYNNVIKNTSLAGIGMFGYSATYSASGATGVNIHHNIIQNCGASTEFTIERGGGVMIEGFDNTYITNNVFDGCYQSAICCTQALGTSPDLTYHVYAKNNIIMNTKVVSKFSNTGYAIKDGGATGTWVWDTDYNCFYNSASGTYYNTSGGVNNLTTNPLCASATDYHLQSRGGRWDGSAWIIDLVDSPCIDKGNPISVYSLEPSPNGGRIDIGRYGGTTEASKTFTISTSHAQIQILSGDRLQLAGSTRKHAFAAYSVETNSYVQTLTDPVCTYRINGGTPVTFTPTLSTFNSDFGTFIITVPSTIAINPYDLLEISIVASEGAAHLSITVMPDAMAEIATMRAITDLLTLANIKTKCAEAIDEANIGGATNTYSLTYSSTQLKAILDYINNQM